MSQIHIVVDSIGQVPDEMLAGHPNLHVVALKVRVGDQEWRENEISTKELFHISQETKQHPKTSQPAPGDFIEVCQPLIKAGKEIIIISVSGGLSGTAEGARSVANMIGGKKIHVIDSGTASVGMVQMAKTALEMALVNCFAKDIVDRLETMAKATHTFLIPDTLEYLYKGGRIGGASALCGSILQIRPLLYLVDGKVAVMDKVRTKQRVVNRMLDELQKYQNLEYIGIGHIDVPEEGEALRLRIQEMYPKTLILPAKIGSVLGAHLGPGLLGLVFQEKI
ncbi:DegV family protein [Pelosinus baikalensis]|uniref:DegV family protein n=1 Tax=Pelosinus baikalensis TaxID=2892015 RepID=A0ABS8HV16_9FIRM|nr:DegV family protein [Pelosinus baikalensis]